MLREMPFEPPAGDPRDQKTYYFAMTPLRRVVTPTIRAGFWTIARLKPEGIENLPRRGAVILAANHLTSYDVIPLQLCLPRPIFFMGKAELFRPGLLDAGLRRMGGFPVHRGAQDEWALKHAERVLQHGQVLGMFPEGTRSKGRGLKPAKSGIARLAIASSSPIVPAAIHGTQYMFRHFPQRTPVRIALGEPIYAERGETAIGLTERVMFALAELLPPEQRGAYRQRPAGF